MNNSVLWCNKYYPYLLLQVHSNTVDHIQVLRVQLLQLDSATAPVYHNCDKYKILCLNILVFNDIVDHLTFLYWIENHFWNHFTIWCLPVVWNRTTRVNRRTFVCWRTLSLIVCMCAFKQSAIVLFCCYANCVGWLGYKCFLGKICPIVKSVSSLAAVYLLGCRFWTNNKIWIRHAFAKQISVQLQTLIWFKYKLQIG